MTPDLILFTLEHSFPFDKAIDALPFTFSVRPTKGINHEKWTHISASIEPLNKKHL